MRRFRGDASFATYLHRIVVNVAYEHLERRRRGRGRNEPLEDRQLETLIAPGASPEQRAREREELRRVFALLDHLSPKRRAAFVLVAVECLPLEEAAALLGANAPAIKQRVLDARRELAAALDRARRRRSDMSTNDRLARVDGEIAAPLRETSPAVDELHRARLVSAIDGVLDREDADRDARRRAKAQRPALALADRRGRGRRGRRARARPPTARTARAGAAPRRVVAPSRRSAGRSPALAPASGSAAGTRRAPAARARSSQRPAWSRCAESGHAPRSARASG